MLWTVLQLKKSPTSPRTPKMLWHSLLFWTFKIYAPSSFSLSRTGFFVSNYTPCLWILFGLPSCYGSRRHTNLFMPKALGSKHEPVKFYCVVFSVLARTSGVPSVIPIPRHPRTCTPTKKRPPWSKCQAGFSSTPSQILMVRIAFTSSAKKWHE